MKKKIMSLLMATILSLSLVACGGNESESPAKNQEKKEEVKEPTDLTGTWKSEENNGTWQEATITESSIEINWVSDGGDTKSLYWAGSYDAPTEYVEDYSWTSNNDHEKTDMALLASGDDTKDFSYKDGVISYEASAMGTTTTVNLTKESN